MTTTRGAKARIRPGPEGPVYHVSPARRVSPNQRPQDRDRCNDLGSKLGGTKEPERKGRLSDLWDIRHLMSNEGGTPLRPLVRPGPSIVAHSAYRTCTS